MKIGVLGLQGDFREHLFCLDKQGAQTVLVKQKDDLKSLDGLVIPGGESTTLSLLLKKAGMFDELRNKIENGLGVFGTCAGLILLAKEVIGKKSDQSSFECLDVAVVRNAYGSQVNSFESDIKVLGTTMHVFFIRAPKIVKVGDRIEVIARLNEDPVCVKQGKILAATFHPELSYDATLHGYFLEMIKEA
jgi:5'-phosphate synthase pdxT subunit